MEVTLSTECAAVSVENCSQQPAAVHKSEEERLGGGVLMPDLPVT